MKNEWRMRFDARAEAEAACGPGQIVTDEGPSVWPRYQVITPPAVGDLVSREFNGDSYPDGEIIRVGTGPRMVVTTSTGSRYLRRGESGAWLSGMWSLQPGHVTKRNPHF